MKIKYRNGLFSLALFFVLTSTGCLSPHKLDAYVADQHNNTVPKQEKLRNTSISVSSVVPFREGAISESNRKTSKVLPLVVYWQFDYRHTCKLNPVIGVNHLIKSINSNAQKSLVPNLAGKKLELIVEEIPAMFSIVDKGHFLLVFIHWDRLYVEPDNKDLVVSYKLTDSSGAVKTNRITVKNKEHNQGIRFAQSWKSSASEYLGRYAQYMSNMGKELVERITNEL